MKVLPKPLIPIDGIYDDCLSEISSDPGLVNRLAIAREAVINNFARYDQLGASHQLYLIDSCRWGHDEQDILVGITKGEFNDLYGKYMVKGNNARKHYDEIKASVFLSKCPYCCLGQIANLDHFLPKAYYPAFSILSWNLVPTCNDCNGEKGSKKVSLASQALHPYYESDVVENEPWLFARLINSTPPRTEFYTNPPGGWSQELKLRIANHFANFNLNERYGIEAASDIIEIAEEIAEMDTLLIRKAHLLRISSRARDKRPNSRKAALFQALAENDWFIQIGYSSYIFSKNFFSLLFMAENQPEIVSSPKFEKGDRIARKGGPSVVYLVVYVNLEQFKYDLREPGEDDDSPFDIVSVDQSYELDRLGVFDQLDEDARSPKQRPDEDEDGYPLPGQYGDD